MKYVANFFRLFVGLLFIFSGLIKLNDPTGFSYKLDEYFSVFSSDLETPQDSISVFVTTLDGTTVHKTAINTNNPISQILASTSEWKAIPVAENEDSLYFSDVRLLMGNTELYTTSINSQDGDSVLLEVTVKYAINNNEIDSKVLDFLYRKENNHVITIDASSYVKENSWLVDFFQNLRSYALALAILMCVLEVVLGLSLLIGWAPRCTTWSLFVMIVLFTFLTWYSAYFNKVTDCGCFGDAIKLTPWESFSKDIVLLVSLLIIFFGLKHIKPIFSGPFSVKLLTVFTILSTGFAMYCWHYLPVKNFLKFKEGNNIKELVVVPDGAPSDVYENLFIYAKDGVDEEFTIEEMTGRDLKTEGYTFVDRIDKLISKGFEPEIHDFKIMDETRSNDYVDDFFADSLYKILIVINDVEKANLEAMEELKTIIDICKRENIQIYPLTASAQEDVELFRHKHQLDIPFYYGDKTNLKSIIRSNPGLVLFDGNVVKHNWPSTRLPSEKKFLKEMTK